MRGIQDLLKSMRKDGPLTTKHGALWMLRLCCKFCNFVAFGVFVNTPSRGQKISETAQKCGCDKMCGVDFTLEGRDKGNEVVKPYKIITKGEVVSSVVTGSLHDNFLLLENKGVTALH